MRIGLTGSQGTGKTSVMNAFAKAHPEFTPIKSTARRAVEAGLKVNREADQLSQMITMVSRITMEDKVSLSATNTISDRTPLDSLAYTAYQIEKEWLPEKFLGYYWEISRDLVISHMSKYDYVFYFPVLWAPKSDGVRDSDVVYQQEIDKLIVNLIGGLEIPTLVMINGSTTERVNYLTNLVN